MTPRAYAAGAPIVGDIDGAALRQALTAHAREVGADESALRAGATRLLKSAYDDAVAKARARLEAGGGGLAAARSLCALTDETVLALYDFVTVHVHRARNPTEGERLAVCAVGGYGRGERAPGSDVDLLFLQDYKTTPWAESVIETMLYVLWDMGLKVGNAARTIDQAVRIAREDWTVLTALMDLRRLCGDAEHPVTLAGRLVDEAFKGRARAFVAAKLAERAQRLSRQGAAKYMVEPDVKEAEGGLRDLQMLDWLSRGVTLARAGSAPAALLFAAEESRRYEAAADFLWRVRCFTHFVSGRAQERLTFDLQPEIARLMGYEDEGAEAAVERFMRDYFLVVRETGTLTSILCAKLETEEAKRASSGFLGMFRRETKPAALDHPDLAFVDGLVAFADPQQGRPDPAAMMRLCATAATREADIHPDALAELARGAELIDNATRAEPHVAEAFFEALEEPRSVETALRHMNETGLLGAYLPEFGRIVARTQFNMYHHYTVDEHILRVVGALAALELGEGGEETRLARALFARVHERRALYLAALLHDVGKGLGDQEIEGGRLARTACGRMGLGEEEVDLVDWLVSHHLLLSDVAQRRDVGDPRTIVDFVAEVGTLERLRLLTLLTIADIKGVGPGVWTDWKRRLIEEVYALAQATFHGGRTSEQRVRAHLASRAAQAREALLASIGEDGREAARAWADNLEDAYWIAFDADAHLRHHDFVAAARRDGLETAVDARAAADTASAELLVVASDRIGLFADIAAAIAGAGADVRDARLFTARDGAVMNVFTIGVDADDHRDGDWSGLARVAEAVRLAASGARSERAALGPAPRRTRAFAVRPSVTFDDEASETATVIEVSGRDRKGLLAALARGLADAGLSVTSAHVGGYGERVTDVFYAVDAMGRKIGDGETRARVRDAMLGALVDADPGAPEADGRKLARARASDAR